MFVRVLLGTDLHSGLLALLLFYQARPLLKPYLLTGALRQALGLTSALLDADGGICGPRLHCGDLHDAG